MHTRSHTEPVVDDVVASGPGIMVDEIVDATSRPGHSLLRAGAASGAIAAIATTAIAAMRNGFGDDLAVAGEPIPLAGFATLTLVGAVLGVAIAALLRRSVRRPRGAFVITTTALTALSLAPDLTADATAGTRLVLALTHVIAATIIVPALARRLPA